MLEIENLAAGYGEMSILKEIFITAREGQMTCILGANGAGKTTLLRCISGLLRAKSGIIRFNEADITRVPAHRISKMGISHVPEGRGIFRRLSVLENLVIAYFCAGEQRDKLTKDQSLMYVFSLFPILEKRRDQQATKMSGGEQQMLTIARALMSQPLLLILDEPSLGLAPLVARDVLNCVQSIKEQGKSILLVEQNTRLAIALADFVYVFANGRVAASGLRRDFSDEDLRNLYISKV